MDKIEKIRQEIERRKGYISVTHFAEELLSFLDTLSEEPVCLYDGGAPSKQKCGDCTIACSVRIEEKPDKSLDEAATKFAYSEGYQDPEYYNIVDAFKAGAKWTAQQGFSQEETVEDKTLELGYDVLPGIDPIINLPNSFKPGDKVIVQVRKK